MKRALISVLSVALLALAVYASQVSFSSKVVHMGMIVSDLEKSVAFYKDVVGMVQADRTGFDVDAEFGKRSGLTDGTPFHVEILKPSAGEDVTQLKLMSFGDKAKKTQNEFIHSNTGVQYLTVLVEDIDPCIERIKQHGVKFCGETPTQLGSNVFVLVQDPDGTFVELIGPSKSK